MDILKKIKEIDIAARCNNRAFYESLICWMNENFSPNDDCSIYKFIKSTQNDCKACISDNFQLGDTLCYYPFRLRVLAEYGLISEEEYASDWFELEPDKSRIKDYDFIYDLTCRIYRNKSMLGKLYLRDKCLELWERKINGND